MSNFVIIRTGMVWLNSAMDAKVAFPLPHVSVVLGMESRSEVALRVGVLLKFAWGDQVAAIAILVDEVEPLVVHRVFVLLAYG